MLRVLEKQDIARNRQEVLNVNWASCWQKSGTASDIYVPKLALKTEKALVERVVKTLRRPHIVRAKAQATATYQSYA